MSKYKQEKQEVEELSHNRAVQSLARFFVYTAMLFGILLVLPHFFEPGDISMFYEDGLLEGVQVIVLAMAAAVFAFGAWLERPMRELFVLLCFASALASIRELDGFFDKMPIIRWEMPGALIIVAAVWFFLRRKQVLVSQSEYFISSASCGVLWAGFMVAVVIAQLIGNGRFLEMTMGDDYHRDYKRVIEETCEFCGYFILFLGALEAVLFDGKIRRNGKQSPAKSQNP
jgi:hypothetical protein